MSNPTRRSVMLSGAAASLAAGTLAAEADQAPSFSPEYWACYHSRIEFESERLLRALETSDDDDPDFAVEREAVVPYREAKARLFEHPVRTVYDIVALLRAVWWDDGHFVRVEDWRENSDEAKTLKAIEPLVGGPWQVPDDLIRLEAEDRARREAAEAARARRPRPDRVCYI